MSKLTKYEKETIVLFNEGEDTAHIQTYNAGLRNRLEMFSKKYPDLCRLDKTYEQGGVSYILDMRMGSTTYIIGVHFSAESKDTLEDKMKRLMRDDVKADNF